MLLREFLNQNFDSKSKTQQVRTRDSRVLGSAAGQAARCTRIQTKWPGKSDLDIFECWYCCKCTLVQQQYLVQQQVKVRGVFHSNDGWPGYQYVRKFKDRFYIKMNTRTTITFPDSVIPGARYVLRLQTGMPHLDHGAVPHLALGAVPAIA